MTRGAVVERLWVYPSTVKVGDIVVVEGCDRSVRNMFTLHGGGKLLVFTDGTSLALNRAGSLPACRMHSTTGA
jgi:hypothetical protein